MYPYISLVELFTYDDIKHFSRIDTSDERANWVLTLIKYGRVVLKKNIRYLIATYSQLSSLVYEMAVTMSPELNNCSHTFLNTDISINLIIFKTWKLMCMLLRRICF